MRVEGVVNTNTLEEHDQYMQDIYELTDLNPLLNTVKSEDMANLKKLKQPEGLPKDSPEKAKKLVEEGRGGWFGYGGQVREYADKTKAKTTGELVQEEVKKTGEDAGKAMEPAIIPADFPDFSEAVASKAIETAVTSTFSKDKDAPGGASTMASSPAKLAEATVLETTWGTKNDNIVVLSSLLSQVDDEKTRDEKKKKTTAAASPSGMNLGVFMGPSEALHRIAQEAARVTKLRNEVITNQNRLIELHAVKVQLLARLASMEGEIYADRVNKALRERAAFFDSNLFIRSIHRGTKGGKK